MANIAIGPSKRNVFIIVIIPAAATAEASIVAW
jgi:hypothetical protein